MKRNAKIRFIFSLRNKKVLEMQKESPRDDTNKSLRRGKNVLLFGGEYPLYEVKQNTRQAGYTYATRT